VTRSVLRDKNKEKTSLIPLIETTEVLKIFAPAAAFGFELCAHKNTFPKLCGGVN
jgi:hypothetical protein